jgi:hypothetical protein
VNLPEPVLAALGIIGLAIGSIRGRWCREHPWQRFLLSVRIVRVHLWCYLNRTKAGPVRGSKVIAVRTAVQEITGPSLT